MGFPELGGLLETVWWSPAVVFRWMKIVLTAFGPAIYKIPGVHSARLLAEQDRIHMAVLCA